ncbi:hypothetical protein JCM8097_001220 [Rhodosporidiobolus ruineniae]
MSTLPTLPTKTRCDKEIPCGNCKKRGKEHLCHIVPHVKPKEFRKPSTTSLPLADSSTSTSGSPARPPGASLAHAPPTTLDDLALLAFSEVEDLRTTIEGLRSKVTGLESLLIAAFNKAKEDPDRVRLAEANLREYAGMAKEEDGYSPSSAPMPTPVWSNQGLPYVVPPVGHPYAHPGGDIFVEAGLPAPPPPPPAAYSSSSSSSSSNHFPPPPLHNLGTVSPAFTLAPIDPSRSLPPPFEFSPSAQAGYDPALSGASTSAVRSGMDEPREGEMEREGSSGDDLREEEVAASIQLEFMALGRNRAISGVQGATQNAPTSPDSFGHHSLPASLVFDSLPAASHPSNRYPTVASLAAVLPPQPDTLAILEHTIEWTNWYHAAVHGPTFRAEVQEFFAHPERLRVEEANPAWLALLFAQMCSGIKHMTGDQLRKIGPGGLTEDNARTLAKTHLDAALACLYRSHFLENHQLHAIQAICVLVVTCQDGAMSNLFPQLLSLGISLAQDLGLHRLQSDEAWQKSVEGQPLEVRARSLIAFETKKRVFWSLTTQDWFNIPYRRTTAVQPTQVTTPLPSNAHDEDLMTGVLTNRPPSEYTVAAKSLIWIQVARVLQQVFEHIDNNPSPSYTFILDLDLKLQQLLDSVPSWLSSDTAVDAPHLPPNAAWMRSTFRISSQHKILAMHRAFFRRFEPSRRRAMDASRAILREAAKIGDMRMWTVPYHISAAASVVCLDLFQRGSSPSILHEERREVLSALSTLRFLSSFSAIAARGAALIDNLLTEEARLPPIPPFSPSSADHPPSAKKRRVDPVAAAAAHLPPLASPPSPLRPGNRAALANLLGPPSSAADFSATPSGLVFPSTSSAADTNAPWSLPPTGRTALDPKLTAAGGFDGLSAGLGLVDGELPASFMHAFLESGFDPLDGAITSPAPDAPWLAVVE